jgi:hypothetical protein
MACNEHDPCQEDCPDLYDNCGCTNPNTFGCTTFTGTSLECTDILNGENGDDILAKIDTVICELQEDTGKVYIDGTDTCPEYLFDKLEEGTNISFNITGTGCDRKLVINAVEGGDPVDVNVQITDDDTTTGYLYDKVDTGTYLTKSVLNPGGNEQLSIDVEPSTLVSADSGNQITIGTDGGLKTAYTTPDGSETKVQQGVGVTVSGTGTLADPYIVSTNPAIQIIRPCFDGIWRNITLVATGNPNVVYASGQPQFRYRFDGTVEFRGQATYTVAFGTYQTANRKYTVTIGSLPTICLSGGELAGTSDLKSINYIDIPQASADQITQQYGYIIRKATANIIIEFQSSFTGATSKSIVVNFEGAVIHPLLP